MRRMCGMYLMVLYCLMTSWIVIAFVQAQVLRFFWFWLGPIYNNGLDGLDQKLCVVDIGCSHNNC